VHRITWCGDALARPLIAQAQASARRR